MPGVAIRPYRLDDAGDVLEAVRESVAELRPWMPWCHAHYSLEESRAWLDAQVPAFAAGSAHEFAIVSAGGRYLGGIGLNRIDRGDERANLGYWVRSTAAGRGVATAAVGLVRDWGFRHTSLGRLELVIALGNVASQRVAEKAGATREGVLGARLRLHGAAHDAVVFAFVRGREAPPRLVEIVAYQPRWAGEFRQIAGRIRGLVGPAALRIDHIGSTAVPGLGAKDVIDLQITVADLDAADGLTGPLRAAGFRHGLAVEHDRVPGSPGEDRERRKLFLREPPGERRVHLHVREEGRFNQRYALRFRDYLRASPPACAGYETLKREAAGRFPRSIDDYLRLKDPVADLIHEAATLWAERVGWRPGDDHA